MIFTEFPNVWLIVVRIFIVRHVFEFRADAELMREITAPVTVIVAVQGVAPDVFYVVAQGQCIKTVEQRLRSRLRGVVVERDRGFVLVGGGIINKADVGYPVDYDLTRYILAQYDGVFALQEPVVRVLYAVGAVRSVLDIHVLAQDHHELRNLFVQLASVGHRFEFERSHVHHVQNVRNRGTGNVLFLRETPRVDALAVVRNHLVENRIVNLAVTAPHDHIVARIVHGHAGESLVFVRGGVDAIFFADFTGEDYYGNINGIIPVFFRSRRCGEGGCVRGLKAIVAGICLGVDAETVGDIRQTRLFARPVLEAFPSDNEIAVGVHGDLRMLLRAAGERVYHELAGENRRSRLNRRVGVRVARVGRGDGTTDRRSEGVVSPRHDVLGTVGADFRTAGADRLGVTCPGHREIAVGVHGHAGPLLHVLRSLVNAELGAWPRDRVRRRARGIIVPRAIQELPARRRSREYRV